MGQNERGIRIEDEKKPETEAMPVDTAHGNEASGNPVKDRS